jgi:hypothetical protein
MQILPKRLAMQEILMWFRAEIILCVIK